MEKDRITLRILEDKLFTGAVSVLSFCTIVPLLLILYYLVRNGISVVNWQFLTRLPRPVGEAGGGISNAIIGTVLLVLIACLLAVPTGILAGMYLAEYKEGKLAYLVRLCADILQGVPSIVIGIVAYVWVVLPMGGFSALSGGIALGVMILPTLVRTTEETLKSIPTNLREASFALGVPYHRTVLKVILPAGMSGIVTGILLSIARISGETAPILFTAFGNRFMNLDPLKPIASLPQLIYNYSTSPYAEWHSIAWGASLVLIIIVLGLNLAARLVIRRWKVQF